ncbi:MAG: hypothetical protein ACJ765_05670 [Chloroflexota bacterium]
MSGFSDDHGHDHGGETGEPIAQPHDAPERALEPAADPEAPAAADRQRRPALERLGLAAIAVVMALLFGGVGVASLVGGEYILAAMGFVGCMMTLVVGGITLLRG